MKDANTCKAASLTILCIYSTLVLPYKKLLQKNYEWINVQQQQIKKKY